MDRIKEIEFEIANDKRKYLNNCKEHYFEYVTIAQKLFASIYKRMEKIDKKGDPWTKYNAYAQELQKEQDTEGEISLLEEAINEEVYTPSSYERLAILYSKKKDFNAAYIICKKWFETDYWKIPNMATGSLTLLDRIEKLEARMKIKGS